MHKCDLCDNPSAVNMLDLADGETHLCLECNNRIMSEKLGIELPPLIHHRFILTDCEDVHHLFDSEFILLPAFKLLRCYECGQTRYKCEVMGELTDGNGDLFNELIRRLMRMLSVKYIQHGSWNDYNVYGYISYNKDNGLNAFIIDGRPYSWEELGKGLHGLDGFQIKIEAARPTDDFEPIPYLGAKDDAADEE